MSARPILPLACCAAIGCHVVSGLSDFERSGDTAATGTHGGGGTSTQSSGAGAAASSSGVGGELPPARGLVNEGLLGRWFLDGLVAPDDLSPDYGPTQTNLAFRPNGNASFFDSANGEGVIWTDGGGTGVIEAIDAVPLLSRVDEGNTLMIELVTQSIDGYSKQGRVIAMGDSGGGGRIAVVASGGTIGLRLDEDSRASWTGDLIRQGRHVVQLCIDLSRKPQAALYVDGDEATGVMSGPAATTWGLDPINHHFTIGNRANEDRANGGSIHYAALYRACLPPAQRDNNRKRLMGNDDP